MNYGVFGSPPKNLAAAHPQAKQFSPLIPGSELLESLAEKSLSGFVMLASPGTMERRYQLALALQALMPGAPFTVLAPKDKGGSRLLKELAQLGCNAGEEARSHHRICSSIRPPELNLETAIAEGAPRMIQELGLWSQPGVFSWNRIDPGSALLARHLPALAGRGADLGCGIGYLTLAALASKKIEQITLIDIDRRAIEAAKRNIPSAQVVMSWADLRTADSKLSGLDFVLTNPPFHDGGSEDQELGQCFIRHAAHILRSGGTCWLVANRHLPYEGVLKTLFSKVNPVIEADGYKVYEALR